MLVPGFLLAVKSGKPDGLRGFTVSDGIQPDFFGENYLSQYFKCKQEALCSAFTNMLLVKWGGYFADYRRYGFYCRDR